MLDADPFSGQLLANERIQWRGAPSQGWLLTSRDIFLIPFGLIWCGFLGYVLFTGFTAPATEVSGRSIVVFVPVAMIVFGVALMFGRFPFDAWLRSRTRYAVTNQRIMIARSAPLGTFTAINLDRLPTVKFDPRGDGRGTLRFGESAPLFNNRGFSTWLPSLDPTPQFLAIDDSKSVFDLVQRLSHNRP